MDKIFLLLSILLLSIAFIECRRSKGDIIIIGGGGGGKYG